MSKAKYFADGTEYTGEAAIGSTITRAVPCYRCGGSGIYSRYHGACYSCNGSGRKAKRAKIYSQEQLDKKEARKTNAKRKKEEELTKAIESSRKNVFAELEGAAMAYMQARLIISSNQHHGTNFLAGLISKLRGIIDDRRVWTVGRGEAMLRIVEKINTLDGKLRKQKRDEAELRQDPSMWIKSGKLTITGTVLTVKWKESMYGDTLKMLVQDDDGRKYWGSVPKALSFEEGDRDMRVQFNASVERSSDDPIFGFFKRPTKATLIEAVDSST